MSRRAAFRAAVTALFIVVSLSGSVAAQPDLDAMLAEAVSSFELGQEDAALAKLKEILAVEPSTADAFRLFNAIEARKWARMLTREGEISKVIMELMRKGRPKERAMIADKDVITALIADLDSTDWGKRIDAYRKLAADHGEYAVPYLVPRLGSDDPMRRAAAISWLRKLGVQAVLPHARRRP